MWSWFFGMSATMPTEERLEEFDKLKDSEEFIKSAADLKIKRQAAIDQLGEKWILHSVHMKQKLEVPLNTLGRSF